MRACIFGPDLLAALCTVACRLTVDPRVFSRHLVSAANSLSCLFTQFQTPGRTLQAIGPRLLAAGPWRRAGFHAVQPGCGGTAGQHIYAGWLRMVTCGSQLRVACLTCQASLSLHPQAIQGPSSCLKHLAIDPEHWIPALLNRQDHKNPLQSTLWHL